MTPFPIPTSEPLSRLVEELNRLPGIGPKTAQRLAYYILRSPGEEARALAEAVLAVKEKVILCSRCQNITDQDPCLFCRDEKRNRSIICVVEEPLDILALERSRAYGGLYHVLHGALSPTEGVGVDDIRIRELLDRLRNNTVKEVILATNTNQEGEQTAMYLSRVVTPLGIKVTRLARGLPFGTELEYADDVTLTRALEGRSEY